MNHPCYTLNRHPLSLAQVLEEAYTWLCRGSFYQANFVDTTVPSCIVDKDELDAQNDKLVRIFRALEAHYANIPGECVRQSLGIDAGVKPLLEYNGQYITAIHAIANTDENIYAVRYTCYTMEQEAGVRYARRIMIVPGILRRYVLDQLHPQIEHSLDRILAIANDPEDAAALLMQAISLPYTENIGEQLQHDGYDLTQ